MQASSVQGDVIRKFHGIQFNLNRLKPFDKPKVQALKHAKARKNKPMLWFYKEIQQLNFIINRLFCFAPSDLQSIKRF